MEMRKPDSVNRKGMGALVLLIAMMALGSVALASAGPPPPITISVDATHVPQRILHAKLVFPVHPGPLTLYYPKWMPADHSPDGPVWNLAGLKFLSGARELPWQQDDVDMYAFHLVVPEGITYVEASLDFLISAPGPTIDFSASGAGNLFILMWNQVVLYPQGWPAAELTFIPTLTLPSEWKFSTSLPVSNRLGNTVSFAPVALDLLVDSPVQSGQFMRVLPLSASGSPPQELDVLSDDAWALDVPSELLDHYKRLVAEAEALYKSHHFREYHFLLTLSDNVMGLGQEHHESSDDRVKQNTLVDPNARLLMAGLFPHEFSHSWNGQYRRPDGLATPDFQQPMKGELLWAYEGLTEYLGTLLSARSGLLTPSQSRDQIALIASNMEHRAGRRWRSLQNTATAAQILYFSVPEWSSYRRGTDFYPEAVLIWLEVDATMRKLTGDRKSMDDFCHVFYAGHEGEPVVKPYTFEELVSTLNGIAPNDWAAFFRSRLDATTGAPLGGLGGSGWRLVYSDEPNEMMVAADEVSGGGDFTSSIGLRVKHDGSVIDSIPGMPAFESGLSPYLKIIAVNGRAFSVDAMKRAIRDSKTNSPPIEVVTENTAKVEVHRIQYHGGSQFPHLERVEDGPDYLGEILKALTPAMN
jgi:predicted metalloprotease with PDZ domain